jgi:hypothetical protein
MYGGSATRCSGSRDQSVGWTRCDDVGGDEARRESIQLAKECIEQTIEQVQKVKRSKGVRFDGCTGLLVSSWL